jgi:hypothetical protein
MEQNPHTAAEGYDADLTVRNIVCHLNFLLTDEQKVKINWHPAQSVSLAVMRLIEAPRQPVTSIP